MSSTPSNQFAYHSGRVVGRYKLQELLGRGATAEVYKTVHPDLNREIAIKILHPFQSHDSEFVQRFQHEAKAVATLIHPNIVQVYDFNVTDDGLYYITMQYVNGPTLDDYLDLEQAPLPLSKSFRIFKQIANALQFAHQLGIVHRDIKPANIMLDKRGDAYLCDFGFAQIIGVELHTHSSLMPGTPIYMAPEQIATSKVTAVADIYALGVILYQMVTAKVPYYGDNLMTVILRKIDEPPKSPRHYNPDLPRPVERVIMKAMAREPSERYQTVDSMLADLQEAVSQDFDTAVNISNLMGDESASSPQRQVTGYQIQRGFSRDEMRPYQRYLAMNVERETLSVLTVLQESPIEAKQTDEQFEKRAKLLLQLDEPGIASARETGLTSDERPYLAYDFVPGKLLSGKLKEWKRSGVDILPTDALLLTRRVAARLAIAHLANLIHNDLRPSHIVLDDENNPTIVGLEIPTSPNVALPKYWDELNYIPPEQVKERWVSVRGNVYTLGVILYEMLAGKRPQIASHGLLDVDDDFVPTAVPLANVNHKLTPKTYDLVDCCLAQDEAKRYGSLQALISQLDEAIQAEEDAMRLGTSPAVSRPAAVRTGRRWRWLVFGTLALALFVVGMVFVWNQLAAVPDDELSEGNPQNPITMPTAVTAEETTEIAAQPEVTANPETTINATAVSADAAEVDETEEEAADANAQEALDARATAEAVEALAAASARLATSRELAAAAISQLNSDPQLSLLLGLEAFNLTAADQAPPGELIDALYRGLTASDQAFNLASHTAQVNDTAVSPDGRWIATASDDTTVKLWDAATGQEVKTFTDHTTPVNTVAFSPDNVYLAAGSEDSLIIVWNIESGAVVRAMRGEDDGAVHTVAFHPDGQRIGAGYDEGTARIWDVTNGNSLLRQFEHAGPINDIAFHPDGILFATAGQDGLLVTQRVDIGQPLFSYFPEQFENGESIAVHGVAYNADGSQIAMAKANGLAQIWQGETLIAALPGHNNEILDAVFSPDGVYLATAGKDGSVKLWMIETQQIVQTLIGHTNDVTAVEFTPDGEQIVTAGQDGTARIWNIDFGLEPLTLSEHRGGVNSIRYNSDGTAVVTGGNDNTARIWDAESGELLFDFRGHDRAVNAAAFHPTLPLVATASDDTNVRRWNLETESVILPFYFHPDIVNDLAFSPDGTLLTTAAADGIVRLWQIETDEVLWELVHDEAVQSVSFNADGSQLVAASGETAVIWDVDTGERGDVFTGHNGLIQYATFNHDGTLLATAGADGIVKLWDLQTNQVLRTFSGHSGPVLWVAFSHDGRQLATSSVDKTTKLWDMETGQAIRTLLGHTSAVNAVAFSPDDSTLATASLDSTARLVPLMNLNELITQAWNRLARPLTPDECTQYLRDLPCLTSSIEGSPPLFASDNEE